VAVIPTGIDLEEFEDTDSRWLQTNFQVSPTERILLFVGRLGKEKNIIFLLESFYRVQQEISDLRLVIAGGGPQEEELRRLCIKLGIEGKVIFTGVLPRNQIVHCYAAADLFVFPSVTETQGLVIAEAKAAGLPVVAIRAFGAAEMVRHGEDGFLAEHSQDSFTGSIIRLLQDRSLYEKMHRNALLNAAELSSASSAEKMLAHYEHLLESKPSSPSRYQPV
jgi:1,2-diacylglycerol 3-alpha-glucosyltransferase